MKKYLKITIVLLVVLTIYSIIVFAISKEENEKTPTDNPTPQKPNNPTPEKPKEESKEDIVRENPDYNIIIYPNNIVSYKNGIWAENKGLNTTNLLFDVYVNNNPLGQKYLTYNDKWNLYENNNGMKNFINYEGELLAVYTNKPYNLFNYTNTELNYNDKNVISSFLNENGITYNYEDLIKSKVIYDVNRDGMRDEIYFVSNAFTELENIYNKSFSIGFVKYYNEIEVIYHSVEDISKSYSICNSYLQNIIEIDGKLYLIVGCTYYSNQGTQHIIYESTSNGINEVLTTSTNN